MATVYPEVLGDHVQSRGERELHQWFSNDQGTSRDWHVIHGVRIQRHDRPEVSELDFLAVVPHRGIIVIEVKGGHVEREGQTWYTTDRHGNRHILHPDPITKSIDNVQYILRNQRRILGTELRIAMTSVVWFSDAEVRMEGAEGARVLPASAIRGDIAAAMLRYLDQTRARMRIADREPTPNTVNLIRQTICPDIRPAPRRREQENVEELNRLTDEQMRAYRAIVDNNNRVLVEGAAGTGKTYVGLAVARARIAQGQRVAFLCFNRLFGDWLRSKLPNNIAYCGNIDRVVHDFLSNHSERFRALPQDQRECDGWRERNIQWAVEALAGHEEWKVDYLILDEAQDKFMLTEDALQFYNSLLRGGLQAGQWMILGDFSRQALYGYREAAEAAIRRLLDQHNVVRIPLNINCRNTTQIARFTYTLAGFGAQQVRPNLRNIGDIPVTVRRYREGDQANVLLQQLDRVVKSVAPSDIIILSPKQMEQSVCSQINGMPGTHYRIYRKRENRPAPQDGIIDIAFATIREFKGLESPCVIVCDVDREIDDSFCCELYVGLSRAVARLVVLAKRGVDLAGIDELREEGIVD